MGHGTGQAASTIEFLRQIKRFRVIARVKLSFGQRQKWAGKISPAHFFGFVFVAG